MLDVHCVYIYIFPIRRTVDCAIRYKNGLWLQYNYDKQSIAQYTAVNKDESKLNHYCNSFGENLSLYMK